MKLSCICWQVQEHTERPVGMALYEMKNGQISNICIQGGECCLSTFEDSDDWSQLALEAGCRTRPPYQA
jgi:uncharacterized cysteine cluster protein YcgN (CxxCxxCC family)